MDLPTDTPRARGPWSLALKTATAEHHRHTEQLVDVRTSFRSVTAYRQLLEVLLGFHAPLETLLRGCPLPGELGAVPPRSARLEADVLALGGSLSSVTRCRRLPDVSRSDHALGVLYVVEGSALGGEVLAGVAARRLQLTADFGAAFYAGEVGRERWGAVLEAVEARGNAGALDQIIGGAVEAFDCLGRWLAAARPHPPRLKRAKPGTQTGLPDDREAASGRPG